MNKKHTPKRGAENSILSVSCSKELKERVKAAAEADRRAVSPWVVIQLEKVLDEMEEQEKGKFPDLKVADEGKTYPPSTRATGVRYPKKRSS